MAETKAHTSNTGVVILAAGSSSRLGTPKQLLLYAGQTLIQHAAAAATTSNASPVMVVLGANTAAIQSVLKNNAAHTVVNTEWEEGIASSIRCGIKALTALNPLAAAVIFMLADQPFVSNNVLNDLMATHQNTGKRIVASMYGDSFGTPALFHKSIFPELLQLKGDAGAKSIIRKHFNAAAFIAFPEGKIDIDTTNDYLSLKSLHHE